MKKLLFVTAMIVGSLSLADAISPSAVVIRDAAQSDALIAKIKQINGVNVNAGMYGRHYVSTEAQVSCPVDAAGESIGQSCIILVKRVK